VSHEDASLTQTTARGGLWLLTSSGLGSLMSLAAQVALGWFLSDNDFGVYAIAIALSTLLLFMQDGGVGLWLSRATESEFRQNLGPAFWLSCLGSIAVALMIIGIAPLAARTYGDQELVPVMLVIGSAALVGFFRPIGFAALQVARRFRTLSTIESALAAVRYSLMVLLAVLGLGPLSFVIPLAVVSAAESLITYRVTRLKPWRYKPHVPEIRSVFRETRWAMLGALATVFYMQADYVALGLVATTSTVGIYYFAYQFSLKPTSLVAEGLRKVVLPSFSTAARDRARLDRACRKGLVLLGAAATPLLIALTLTAPEIEQLLWRGRWQAAVLPIQIISLVLPLEMISRFTGMVAMAVNQFSAWTLTSTVRGAGLAVAAFVAGWIAGGTNATIISMVIAGYIGLTALPTALYLLGRAGTSGAPGLGVALVLFGVSCGVALTVGFLFSLSPMTGWPPLLRFISLLAVYAALLLAVWRLAMGRWRTEVADVVSGVRSSAKQG
jgi:O-antigen/teichoic acid export membrane protein